MSSSTAQTAILEIVLWCARDGATEAQVLAAADALQRDVAAFPGYLRRRVLRAEDGQWADLVEWTSLEEARAAAEAVMARPSAGAFMALVDEASVRMLHATPRRAYGDAVDEPSVEIVLFGTDHRTTEADLLTASDVLRQDLARMDGYRGGRLLRTTNDAWVDVTEWASLDAARKASEASMARPSARRYMELVDMSSVRVLLLDAVRSYGREAVTA